jgi:hypothetical protein
MQLLLWLLLDATPPFPLSMKAVVFRSISYKRDEAAFTVPLPKWALTRHLSLDTWLEVPLVGPLSLYGNEAAVEDNP